MLLFLKFAGASRKMEIVRMNVLANFIKLTYIQNRTLHYATLGFMPGDHFNPNRILSGVFVLSSSEHKAQDKPTLCGFL